MYGTICKVILTHSDGDLMHVFVSEDVLTKEEIVSHIRSKGFAGEVGIFDNMQNVDVIPPKPEPGIVYIRRQGSGEVICSGETAHDAVSQAAADKVSLANADLSGHKLNYIKFYGLDLAGADFSDCELYDGNFVNSDCRNVNFTNAKLTHACFRMADVRGAEFSRANLSDVDFSGAKF